MQRHAINWFEIPVSDFDRAKKFYSKIYDYDMPEMMMGEDRIGILLYDRAGGGVGGAIVKGKDYRVGKDGAKIYLAAGSDLSVVLNRVAGAGGKEIMGKTEVAPGLGHMALIEDTEGNLIYLHSDK